MSIEVLNDNLKRFKNAERALQLAYIDNLINIFKLYPIIKTLEIHTQSRDRDADAFISLNSINGIKAEYVAVEKINTLLIELNIKSDELCLIHTIVAIDDEKIIDSLDYYTFINLTKDKAEAVRQLLEKT